MIWCVEDDASIRDIEVYALQSTGFEAKGFEDGTSFWEALRTGRPELVVLDVMLPGIDGMELLRRMRADAALSDIPVVMATAKGAEYDKIRGLDLGADYYLDKAVRRDGARLLRQSGAAPLWHEERPAVPLRRSGARRREPHRHGGWRERRADIQGIRTAAAVPLASRHGVFARPAHGGRVGHDYCGETRTVDMHIRTLRQKLGAYGEKIETVRGVGYRMEGKGMTKRSSTPSCLWPARCCWRACSSSWAACTNTSGASKKSSCATSWSLPPSP